MSTVIGYSKMVNGSGVKYHSVGGGIAGKVAAAALRHIGHKAVDKAADMMAGGANKIAGEGRHRKIGRPTKANAAAYKKRHAKKK